VKVQTNKLLWIIVALLLAALLLTVSLYVYQQRSREERAEYFEELCTLTEKGNFGYANEYFRATKSFIVLRRGETEEFKLTANWEGGGSVFVDCSSDAAELAFTEESWDRYTTMTVAGIHPGFTAAHFTSDATDKSFYICVFVEE